MPSHVVNHGVSLVTRALVAALLLSSVTTWVACGGGGGAGGGAGGTGAGATGGSGQTGGASAGGDPLLGAFIVTLAAPVPASATTAATPGSTTILGRVSDGATPALTYSKQTAADGACQLLVPVSPFCATPCGSGACVADGVCQAYPMVQNLGDASIDGINCGGATTGVALKNTSGNYQLPSGVACVYPGFAEGDTVRLTTTGGDLPAFNVTTVGIAPLALTNASLPLAAGQALTLTWKAASNPKASRVHVKLDISHHGGSRGAVTCDSDDTGSVTISGDLMTKLLALGVAGYPTVIVTRTSTGTASLAKGHVELRVSSEFQTPVQIAGLESCGSDEECPTGKTCQADLTCK